MSDSAKYIEKTVSKGGFRVRVSGNSIILGWDSRPGEACMMFPWSQWSQLRDAVEEVREQALIQRALNAEQENT